MTSPTISIRAAVTADGPTLTRLAALDSARPPFGPTLIAEVDGEPRAALSLADGAVIADPFHPATALIELLRARAAQLSGTRQFATAPRRSLPRRVALSVTRRVRRFA